MMGMERPLCCRQAAGRSALASRTLYPSYRPHCSLICRAGQSPSYLMNTLLRRRVLNSISRQQRMLTKKKPAVIVTRSASFECTANLRVCCDPVICIVASCDVILW